MKAKIVGLEKIRENPDSVGKALWTGYPVIFTAHDKDKKKPDLGSLKIHSDELVGYPDDFLGRNRHSSKHSMRNAAKQPGKSDNSLSNPKSHVLCDLTS